MEGRKVLALKYRPKKFSDLIGQDSISKTLSLALDSGRLAHAYLFSGIRGSGKTSSARILSKSLNCDKGPTSTPCESCENCTMANEGRHIDIIEMDAASSRKIDDIRELIEHTRYKPTIGRYKIFIIDEVHMLTKEAFNALLKTLEEPPPFVKFILATTDPLKLPPTILSRTQHFRFKKIGRNETIAHMEFILAKEGVEYEREALEILARSGGGSLRDTLTLLEQAIIYGENRVGTSAVADMLGIVDPKRFYEILDAVFEKDIEKLKGFAKELDENDAEIAIDEMIEFLSERLYEKDPKYSPLIMDRFFRILSDAKSMTSLNINGSFILMLMFYKMVEALKIKDIDKMIEELEDEVAIARRDNLRAESTPTTSNLQPKEQKIESIKEPFDLLVEKLYKRNYELGELFQNCVEFVSFENGILRWNSYANDEESSKLRRYWQPIKQCIIEVFGAGTKIELEKKEPKKKIELNPQKKRGETQEESLSTTMDIIRPQSCSNPILQEQGELTKEEIENHPMMQKAIELFEPKSIMVYSRV